MSALLALDLELPALRLGVVRASGVQVAPSPPALALELDAAVARVRDGADEPAAVQRRAVVRDLLRGHGYRPTGRGKPASEYLERAAREGSFPRINNLVDINNLVSLRARLPVSMLDLDRFAAPPRLRHGREGERYVFNPAGHAIDLQGLLVVCAGDQPLGSPVKDAMAGKVVETTRQVLAVLYASTQALPDDALRALVHELAQLLRAHAGAREVQGQVLCSVDGAAVVL